MLPPPPSVLNAAILALSPSANKDQAITAFCAVIANYMDGSPVGGDPFTGILTVNQSAMYDVFVTQTPVNNNSWIDNFAEAWYQGVFQGTYPPAASIPTLPTAKALLESELASATFNNNPAMPFAQAVYDATVALLGP